MISSFSLSAAWSIAFLAASLTLSRDPLSCTLPIVSTPSFLALATSVALFASSTLALAASVALSTSFSFSAFSVSVKLGSFLISSFSASAASSNASLAFCLTLSKSPLL